MKNDDLEMDILFQGLNMEHDNGNDQQFQINQKRDRNNERKSYENKGKQGR